MVPTYHHFEFWDDGVWLTAQLQLNLTLSFTPIWRFSLWVHKNIWVDGIIKSKRIKSKRISRALKEGVSSKFV